MIHVLVTGSHRLTGEERDWAERTVRSRLRAFPDDAQITFYGGDAWGVDYIAERAAKSENWVERRIFPAQWREFGKSAGIQRNALMLTRMIDAGVQGDEAVCLAFLPKGQWTPGALDMSKRVIRQGVRLEIWTTRNASAANLLTELGEGIDSGSAMVLTSA